MPRKGENIYKRKDGRWEGRYIKSRTLEGKAKYGYVYARSYRETKVKLARAISSGNKTFNEETAEKKAAAAEMFIEETDLRKKMEFQDNLSESEKTATIKETIIKEETETKNKSKLFQEIADEWLQIIQPQIKESTSNKYQNILSTYILPVFGKSPLESITQDSIENYCNTLLISGGKKGTGLSAKTVSDILSVMRSIFRFAAKKGIPLSCDTSSVQVKQTPKEMRVLSRSEQERLCQYLYSDLTARNIGILICLFTGLRVGELCALQWKDISLGEQTIHVCQTMQRIQDRSNSDRKTKIVVTAPKSVCSVRTIPISQELVQIITDFQSGFPFNQSSYFLTGSSQKYIEPRIMQKHFKQVLQKCSIAPANYHALRHTFATRCVELGFDVKCLSEILGHASVNITMNRYVHPSIELKRENMQKLSSLFTVK